MNIEIDKKALDKLQRQLKEVAKKDVKATLQGMIATGYEIHAEAVKKVPVDMGRVRTSLAVESDSNKMEVRIGTNVKYAPFVEFGTRKMHAQPYLRPAFMGNIGKLAANIRRFIKK